MRHMIIELKKYRIKKDADKNELDKYNKKFR